MPTRDPHLRAIFERYGYDPDDPVRGLDVPDKLLRVLSQTRFVEPGEPLERQRRILLPPTERELEALELVACGCTAKEIAARQFCAVETVRSRLASTYHKLGARSAANAVAIAIARKMIPVEIQPSP